MEMASYSTRVRPDAVKEVQITLHNIFSAYITIFSTSYVYILLFRLRTRALNND